MYHLKLCFRDSALPREVIGSQGLLPTCRFERDLFSTWVLGFALLGSLVLPGTLQRRYSHWPPFTDKETGTERGKEKVISLVGEVRFKPGQSELRVHAITSLFNLLGANVGIDTSTCQEEKQPTVQLENEFIEYHMVSAASRDV